MRIKKNKIWIISLILINLMFIVFQNYYKIENTDFNDNYYRGSNDNISNLQSSSIDWYSADWQYRKVINITTGSAAVTSNYSISLTFDHASLVNSGKSRADGNDIRVVYNTGSNWDDLDRILDASSSWNNDSTTIWFKIQTPIAASSFDSNYYLYYGNSLAGLPPINSTEIFILYDDFESGNFGLWDGNSTATGDSITISSTQTQTGNYAAKALVDNQANAQAIIWKDFSGYTSLFAKIHIYLDSSFTTSGHVTVMQFVDLSTGWQNILSATINNDMTLYMWNDYVGEAYGYLATNSISVGTWHLLEMQATFSETAGEARLWLDGNLEIEETSLNLTDSSSIRYCAGYYWGDPKDEVNTLYIDNSYLRPWVNPEPVATLKLEEKLRPSTKDFAFYKEITIDHTKVSGTSDLSNFPVLISIFDSDLHVHTQPDGDDIAFYNGTDWLFHEIELFNQSYNSTHAQLVAWVRIPSLSCTFDTIITMYYGNSTIGSQEYPDRVWDSDYKGVWHLKEDPSISKIEDSTINSYHGTSHGSMTSSNQIKGQIGGSMKFDGLNDYINLGSASGLKLTDAFTFEAWYSGIYNGTVNTRSPIFTNGFSFSNNIGIRVEAFHSTAGSTNREARIAVGDGSNFNYLISDYGINDNTWTYLVCTYDGSTLKLYINGTKQIDELNTNIAYNTNNATIGRNLNNAEQWYKGLVDEIRFLAKNCSAEWIATEYNNQYDPNSFYSIGMEKSTLAHNANYFAYYKVITINSTKVSGSSDLINFPILLSIFDSDLHDHAQVDGDDIAFYSGGKWLDHEIEIFNRSYSGTQAQLVTWIRIPSLSTSVDTNITMYYGNSTIGSQENPNGVWDPNFVGVWHLDESGTGVVDEYIDSGHYGNNGQGGSGNVSYIPDRISGVIGFGQDFVDNFIDCGNATSLDITTNQITMQLWMKYPATHPWMGPFNHKGYSEGYRLVMNDNSQYLRFQLPGDENDLQTSQTISADVWHYVVATYNGSLMRIYVDGIPDSANLTKLNNVETALPAPFRIGHGDHPEGVAWSYPWLGQIDEVRISNIDRSADWIATEYNNQYNPNSFYTIGSQIGEDLTPPDITINSPNPNELFGLSAPSYNLTVIDANLDSIWYSLNGGANSTPVSASGTIDETMWSALGNGTVTIRFYANDTIGYLNYEEVTVRKDIINPSIIINSPTPSSSHSTPPSYSLSITEANIDEIWYTLDGGTTNYTGTSSGTIDSTAWGNAGLGAVTITFYVNDSVGNWNFTSVGIIKTSDLSISINTPKAAEWFNSNPDYEVYVNGNDRDSIWYTIDNGINNYTITNNANQTSTWFGVIDATAWGNAGQGSITLTFYLNNTYGMVTSDSLQINKDSIDPSIDGINLPLSGAWFNSNPPDYSLSITETNLEEIWYTLDGGTTNYTGASSGTIDATAWSNAGQGSVTIIFYVNDSAGNWDSASVIINRDSIDPLINSIDSPLSGVWFSSNPPDYSLSITETNLEEIWYTLNGGATNYTGASSGTIDATAWSNAGQGSVTITFYVNDSAGNWDSSSVIINRDTIDPLINSIDSPLSGVWFSINPPDYSLSITETNLEEIWYTLNGGATNYTGASSGTIDASAWSNAGQGSVTITFYVNDSAGNWDSSSVIINRDTIDPLINSIDSPLSGVWFSSNPPDYSLSVTETNLEEIWYTLNGGTTNYTGASSGTIDATAWSNAGQGSVTITFYVNDSAGNWDSSSVIINRDTIDPSINSIDLPLPDSNHSAPPSYSLSITETNLDDIWYTLDGGLTNYTGALSGTIDSIAWGNAGLGAVTITFYINDSVNNWDSASVVITKTSDLSISINSPNIAQWFSSIPGYDVYVSGNDRDSIWYTLDNGITNFTITSTANLSNTWLGLIDSTVWSNAGEGSVTITFYLNNTFGIILSDSVQINKDTIDPTIDSIDSPVFGVWFNSNPPDYSLSITEVNLDEIWYTLDGGTTNYTGVSSGTIDSTAWSNAGEGSVTIIFYVNDSAGNWDYASVIINRDSIDPLINNIDSPLSGAWFNSNPPDYSLTITEANLDEIWYTLDGGAINYTGASSGTIDATAWSNAGEGSITIIFYINDSAGNWDSASVIINRDSIDPTITITKPDNYDLFGTTPPDITININDSNLDVSWYQLDNGTVITNNYTWAGFIDQNVWDQVGNGTIIIRFYANDTVGNLANAEVIVYKDINLPIITIINPSLSEVYNATAPSFVVGVSGSNLDSTWYTLNNGVINYTFTGLTGSIDQSAWTSRADGTVTIKFYINNTLGVLDFDEVDIIKDTIAPQISLNLPLNNTYCGDAPFINALVTDANLNTIWYEVNTSFVLLANNINQQLETSIWSNLFEGEFYIYIYANDSARNLSDPLIIRLYKDTNAPSAPNLMSFPQGVVSGNLLFEWEEGSDPSGILKYRLIIDNEANPFVTPGFVFETNVTGSSYTFTGNLQPGTYYFFLYQIDGVGHQSSASTGSFSISSNAGPSEFPIWIIFIIIGAAIAGVVGIIVLKKSKGKKEIITQIPEKKPVVKVVQEVPEEISQLDYDILSVMNHNELISREDNLLEYIRHLEENKKYGKAAEVIGEVILIEDILGNYQEVKLYRQKQIDMAIRGLEYLKDQYEIESKNAALSGDYSKALELYNESKVISDNLKGYMEHQESSDTEESIESGTMEPQPITGEAKIVYSCINDLLTKYFDDIGIKYYSNPQIYKDIQTQVHGLILADQFHLEDIDPSMRGSLKSIQIIFTEDTSNATITNFCQTFHNPAVLLIIVGIKWPMNVEAQIIEIPPNLGDQYQENIRIIHYELFMTLMGLTGAYETAFKEIIDLYNKSEIEILQEIQESSEVIIHSTDELRYDLKEKRLIMDKLEEYFNR